MPKKQKTEREPTKAVLVIFEKGLWKLVDEAAAKKKLTRTKYLRTAMISQLTLEREEEKQSLARSKRKPRI